MSEKTEMTLAAWHSEGIRRFGPDEMNWRFVCPLCGHVAAPRDFKKYRDKGATPDSAYKECIGRYGGAGGLNEEEIPVPCDYAAYGLIRLAPVQVRAENGALVECFAFDGVE